MSFFLKNGIELAIRVYDGNICEYEFDNISALSVDLCVISVSKWQREIL